jgi:hypothetical protein
MKKIFTLLAAAFISLSAAGQDDEPDFSGFESDMIKPYESGVKICGGVTYDLSAVGEDLGLGATGFLGANFYGRLRAGGYIGGLLAPTEYTNKYGEDLYFGYLSLGGFVAPRFFPDKKVSVSVPVRIGYGNVSYDAVSSSSSSSGNIDNGNVFAVTPGVFLEVNFTKFFSLITGISVTVASGAELYDEHGYQVLYKNDLNRIMFSVGGVFGKNKF